MASWIFKFVKFYWQTVSSGGPRCIIVLNFIKIGLSVTEILQCLTIKTTVVHQHAMLVALEPRESWTSRTRDLVDPGHDGIMGGYRKNGWGVVVKFNNWVGNCQRDSCAKQCKNQNNHTKVMIRNATGLFLWTRCTHLIFSFVIC